jgi:hypothetical protein
VPCSAERPAVQELPSPIPGFVGLDPRPLVLFDPHALIHPSLWAALASDRLYLQTLALPLSDSKVFSQPVLGSLAASLRAGLEHLLTLLPTFRLGIYTSASSVVGQLTSRLITQHLMQHLCCLPVRCPGHVSRKRCKDWTAGANGRSYY